MLRKLIAGVSIYAGYRGYQEYYMHPLPFGERYGKKSWVVITGSSDGIGLEFANQFASRGFNIVMIARNQERLEQAADKVAKGHGVKVKTIQADFADENVYAHIDRIVAETEDLDVSVLINNAGKLETRPLNKTPEDDIEKLLRINVLTPTLLTQGFVNRLMNRKNRSALINMSSLAAKAPGPNAGIYAASKAYDLNFSLSLYDELRDNVDVLAVLPGYIKTPMTANMKDDANFYSPKECVEGALKYLGRDALAYGVREHSMQGFLLNFVSYKQILKMRAKMQSKMKIE